MMNYRKILHYLFLLAVAIKSSAQQPTIRIMPLGDSITVGNEHVPGAYRSSLRDDLEDVGYSIEFVGSSTINSPASSLSNHEGHRQWRIRDMHEHVGQFLDEADPDIILLMIGTADMGQGDDLENVMSRFDDLILKIATIRPFAYIIASNILYRVWDEANNNIEEYFNPYVEDIINSHAIMGRRVSFIDIHSWLGTDRFPEDLFPDQHGYDQIGLAWSSAIQTVMGPYGDGSKPSILRTRGGLDRHHFTITFNKSINGSLSSIANILIDGGLSILSSALDDSQRILTLTTSEQTPGIIYTITLLDGVIISIDDLDFMGVVSVQVSVGWRFLSLSDLHVAEKYVFRQNTKEIANDKKVIKLLKDRYGGDFVMITGDTNAGFWDKESHRKKMSAIVGSELTPQEAVLESGDRCYSGIYSTFREGGFHKLVMAFGDHEAGDNAWPRNSLKSRLQPEFRQTFAQNFNFDYDGNFVYDSNIGDALPRPFGTAFEETSYAFIHQNALIITIDVLYQKSVDEKISYTGTVTGKIEGLQLAWLEDVLIEAQNEPSVKHIFVQGHFPVLFPVRKVKSSGMYMSDNNTEFFEILKQYNVDIYFAGEVHLNTVTKDPESDLIQIASRGNYFSSFLSIDLTDDTVDITCYEEYGYKKVMHNYNYRRRGRLLLKKNDDEDHTIIQDSWGELQIMDRSSPMIHFSFEEITNLWKRPVAGLGGLKSVENTPIVEEVPVNGVICRYSLPNMGAFGQNYDAQVANLNLVEGMHGNGAEFNSESRVAIWGMGPHSGGRPVSYSLWFNTLSKDDVILIAYEGFWTQKAVMNLRLSDGRPELCYSSTQKVVLTDDEIYLNDGLWHHLAVSIPYQDCLVSEIRFYVDGVDTSTMTVGDDDAIHFPNGGVLSVGGFGHGRTSKNAVINDHQREGFETGEYFTGVMDDVFVWSRSISYDEVRRLVDPPVGIVIRTRMSYAWKLAMCIGLGREDTIEHAKLWPCSDNDTTQHWLIDSSGFIHNKQMYSKCLAPFYGQYSEGSTVALLNCDDASQYDFSWNLSGSTIQYAGNPSMYLTVTEGREKELMLSAFDKTIVKQKWDIVQSSYSNILTEFPSISPSSDSSYNPSSLPSFFPSVVPSSTPSDWPSLIPSDVDTMYPTSAPSNMPSNSPTNWPSNTPSESPTSYASSSPSDWPSNKPSLMASYTPSNEPSDPHPSTWPSNIPTSNPSEVPSSFPSLMPTVPTTSPTSGPSIFPTIRPSSPPTTKPSLYPTLNPSTSPSSNPTVFPTIRPSFSPSFFYPSSSPTHSPTAFPTLSSKPTIKPTKSPTTLPTTFPSKSPTLFPTKFPTGSPIAPTEAPTEVPTERPSDEPSMRPSKQPSTMPSDYPTISPTTTPTIKPTFVPSDFPSFLTEVPSLFPSDSSQPSSIPTLLPTDWPSLTPTESPTDYPSVSADPSASPTGDGSLLWVREYDQMNSDVEVITSVSFKLSPFDLVLFPLCALVTLSVIIC